MKKYHQLFAYGKILVIALILALGISFALAADWSAPSFDPPSCPDSNPACHVPINVSVNPQSKIGNLAVMASVNPDWPLHIGKKANSNYSILADGHILTFGAGYFNSGAILENGSGPDPVFQFKTADAGTGKCLMSTDATGKAAWGDCAGGSRTDYYMKDEILQNQRNTSIAVPVERCVPAGYGGSHECFTMDCNPGSTESSGSCIDKYVSRIANVASVRCDTGDVAISASLADRNGLSYFTSLTPILDSDNVPVGYNCVDVSPRGGVCHVTCKRF